MEPRSLLPRLPSPDRWIVSVDQALRTLTGSHQARRPMPRSEAGADPLQIGPSVDPAQQSRSAALMRVNHVGEVCAQALYSAQALATTDPALQRHFDRAADEEVDHLVWTRQRLRELGSRASLLDPLWYAGSFAIGLLAARAGDRASLGFVIETERQVEAHLQSHLERLPTSDGDSRAIVAAMQADEVRHADEAQAAGGQRPPLPVRWLMQAAAKVMTTTAERF